MKGRIASIGKELPLSDQLTGALAEVMPVGGDVPPDVVRGFAGANGQWKRIVADYPNGWRLTVLFSARGEVSSAKASFRMAARP